MFKGSYFCGFPLFNLKVKALSHLRRNSSSQVEMRVLNVAEKNDAAHNITKFLARGPFSIREGFSKYNKIYEFECEAFGQNTRMIMTSVSGHLLNYNFIGSFLKWSAVKPIELFEAPVEKKCLRNYESIKITLEKEIKSCSKLIIWTDCDREGENIGFEIIDVCQAVKPNISVHRAKFSEITKNSVEKALRNLELPNKHISDAVDVRQILDLRIGAAFTRFQTLQLRKAFPNALEKHLVSYGSCQFPTLGFVTERFKAISQFIPEKFWQINVQHKVGDLTVAFNWKRNRLFDKLACEVLCDRCKEGKVGTVENVESKGKTKWRPRPLNTVELEKLAVSKLRIGAKEALTVAEKLYLKGLISYPRTETTIFPKDLDLVSLVQQQTEDSKWGEFAGKVLSSGPNPFQGNKTDEAHPPIHPVKYSSMLSGNESKIYELIVRHFLACLFKHAEGLETVVDIDIADEKFIAKGLMITAQNYLEVYPYERWSDKEIHVYHKGDKFEPDILMAEGETQPPELLTEADLIALMEKHGIGTDATHADHIETIKARLYVGVKDEKYLVPRTLGMGLVEAYRNMGYEMAQPQLRAELESDLSRICSREKSPDEVLVKHIQNYKEVFEGVERQVARLSETIETYLQVKANPVEPETMVESPSGANVVKKCTSCHRNMTLKKFKEKFFLSCDGFPKCREAVWFSSFVEDATIMPDTCFRCGPNTHLIKFTFQRGSCFLAPIYVGCAECDDNLSGVLNVSKGSEVVSSVRPTRSDDSGFGSNNGRLSWESASAYSSAAPNCHCGVPALRLTVKKLGHNFGRTFFKCSSPVVSGRCDFFEWQDEKKPRSEYQTFLNISFDDDVEQLRCYCAIPCRRAVSKNGLNKGREFYTCGRPYKQGDQCNFFQWVDNDENKVFNSNQINLQRNFSFASNQRTLVQGIETKSEKKRRCGICGQEGHNRKSCPRG